MTPKLEIVLGRQDNWVYVLRHSGYADFDGVGCRVYTGNWERGTWEQLWSSPLVSFLLALSFWPLWPRM